MVAAARAWMAHDPDAETRAELDQLLIAGDLDELHDRFATSLRFGTAGLRARMGAGPNRMNRLVVRRATVALMRQLGRRPRVVVGHDARRNSEVFARDTAAVVTALGGEPLLLGQVPTPVVAFAVRDLGAQAGVVCTASHNPPADNGYKVYGADGAQIVPPLDDAIADVLASLGHDEVPTVELDAAAAVPIPPDDVIGRYVDHVVGLVRADTARRARVAYSPLHGVGGAVTRQVFAEAGFDDVHVVDEQAEPDGSFPTTPRPNPEERAAWERTASLAASVDADVALVHDPDADRLGVLAPTGSGWTALTGNQIGALLADHVLSTTSGSDRLVVDTIVSSRLLESLAREHGVHHARTLTGFKWIVRAAPKGTEQADGTLRFVFGYEEALGFSVDGYVRDKDGISAALVFAELVAELRARGRTIWDQLRDIHRRHGLFVTATWPVDFEDDLARRAAVLERLFDAPPRRLAGLDLADVVDHRVSIEHPPTPLLELRYGGALRVSIRPSGTEPRLKIYGEVAAPFPADGDELAAERDAKGLLEVARGELLAIVRDGER